MDIRAAQIARDGSEAGMLRLGLHDVSRQEGCVRPCRAGRARRHEKCILFIVFRAPVPGGGGQHGGGEQQNRDGGERISAGVNQGLTFPGARSQPTDQRLIDC